MGPRDPLRNDGWRHEAPGILWRETWAALQRELWRRGRVTGRVLSSAPDRQFGATELRISQARGDAASGDSCDDEWMPQDDFGSDADYESWDGNYDAPNSRRVLDAFESEIGVQRANQDGYVNDLRSRSITVLSAVSGALLVFAAFADLAAVSRWFVGALAFGVAGMVLGAVQVHRPRGGFYKGPELQHEMTSSKNCGALDVAVRWRIAEWTAENIRRNEDGPIAWMQWWFLLELVSAAVVVVAGLLGVATV